MDRPFHAREYGLLLRKPRGNHGGALLCVSRMAIEEI